VMSVRAIAMARCDLPVPVPPMRTALRSCDSVIRRQWQTTFACVSDTVVMRSFFRLTPVKGSGGFFFEAAVVRLSLNFAPVYQTEQLCQSPRAEEFSEDRAISESNRAATGPRCCFQHKTNRCSG
jgi:hypothetical protein